MYSIFHFRSRVLFSIDYFFFFRSWAYTISLFCTLIFTPAEFIYIYIYIHGKHFTSYFVGVEILVHKNSYHVGGCCVRRFDLPNDIFARTLRASCLRRVFTICTCSRMQTWNGLVLRFFFKCSEQPEYESKQAEYESSQNWGKFKFQATIIRNWML